MKREGFCLLYALLMAHMALGQQLRFGVKGGLNYANFRIKNVVGPDRLAGVNVGVMARYSFGPSNFWNIQSELLYSAKGSTDKYGLTSLGGRAIYKYRRNYLDLPILAKINLQGLTFEAGPQLSYLVSVSDTNDNPLFQHPARRDYNSLQLGYAAGLGYEIPVGLSLTVRYAGDVTDVYNGGGARNSVFQAQLGYLFQTKSNVSAN
ncbi:porin family protein [Hymenobacter crusticola]|uniref:Outer membrane protein beta-barrel domain-containing protein n=1 Tax=Hymenobacter crusticola TaxID=1770526 RepID=A0A243W845_9BACT|nr:porin family protein [Hymenobacter crusticola]OUJ71239.1 hypothetical protein BXP70_22440 [Hymenobacter crusticola]